MVGSFQVLSSSFHLATNGASERTNMMVEQYLGSYVWYQQTDWAELLPFAEVIYNNAVHNSTGLVPFQIVNGIKLVPIPVPLGDSPLK